MFFSNLNFLSMKNHHSKKMLLLLFSAIGLLAACAKGGSDSGSNSNNSSNNTNNNSNNTPPPATTVSYTVSLFAGSQTGAVDGTGANAGFKSPRSMTMDINGNLFVSDPIVNEIREVTPAAVVTTFATSANFTNVSAPLIVDPSDNVYIAETNFYKVAPGGALTVLNLGVANVSAMTVDATGNTYLCASGIMHKITSSGAISILAGSGQGTVVDGTGTAASFSAVSAMATDASGSIYAADVNGGKCVIRKITPTGVVTSITLTPAIYVQPNVTYANAPIGGICVDGSGNIYATETQGNLVIGITPSGSVTTIAGNGGTAPNNGPAASAGFYYPLGITVNSTGKLIYVADSENKTIRKITTP